MFFDASRSNLRFKNGSTTNANKPAIINASPKADTSSGLIYGPVRRASPVRSARTPSTAKQLPTSHEGVLSRSLSQRLFDSATVSASPGIVALAARQSNCLMAASVELALMLVNAHFRHYRVARVSSEVLV